MKEIVVVETMEDIDKDKNGYISLEEYIGDMYRGIKNEDEPDWVRNEREQFQNYRDKNKEALLKELKSFLEADSWEELNRQSKLKDGAWSGQVRPCKQCCASACRDCAAHSFVFTQRSLCTHSWTDLGFPGLH